MYEQDEYLMETEEYENSADNDTEQERREEFMEEYMEEFHHEKDLEKAELKGSERLQNGQVKEKELSAQEAENKAKRQEQLAKDYQRIREEAEKEKKKISMLGVMFFPIKLIFDAIKYAIEAIAYHTQPKAIKEEMVEAAIKEAKIERDKAMKEREKETPEIIDRKMEIVRSEKISDKDKVELLAKLCYKTGRKFPVATEKGAFMFEREGDYVTIMYCKKQYRTLEEKQNETPHYPFASSRIGAIEYGRFGKQNKKSGGALSASIQLLNNKDNFDPNTVSLKGTFETDRVIAYKDLKEVELTRNEEEERILNQAIISNDRAKVNEFVNRAMDVATLEEHKFMSRQEEVQLEQGLQELGDMQNQYETYDDAVNGVPTIQTPIPTIVMPTVDRILTDEELVVQKSQVDYVIEPSAQEGAPILSPEEQMLIWEQLQNEEPVEEIAEVIEFEPEEEPRTIAEELAKVNTESKEEIVEPTEDIENNLPKKEDEDITH